MIGEWSPIPASSKLTWRPNESSIETPNFDPYVPYNWSANILALRSSELAIVLSTKGLEIKRDSLESLTYHFFIG